MLRATGHARMVKGLWEQMGYCRLTTYRHRFARAAPAPRAKIQRIVDSKNRGRASPVKWDRILLGVRVRVRLRVMG